MVPQLEDCRLLDKVSSGSKQIGRRLQMFLEGGWGQRSQQVLPREFLIQGPVGVDIKLPVGDLAPQLLKDPAIAAHRLPIVAHPLQQTTKAAIAARKQGLN